MAKLSIPVDKKALKYLYPRKNGDCTLKNLFFSSTQHIKNYKKCFFRRAGHIYICAIRCISDTCSLSLIIFTSCTSTLCFVFYLLCLILFSSSVFIRTTFFYLHALLVRSVLHVPFLQLVISVPSVV